MTMTDYDFDIVEEGDRIRYSSGEVEFEGIVDEIYRENWWEEARIYILSEEEPPERQMMMVAIEDWEKKKGNSMFENEYSVEFLGWDR